MRLNPKRLGDEFNLDEYNACQYLLYNMDCWGETVDLDMVGVTGTYSNYTLEDPLSLLEWYGQLSYKVVDDVDEDSYISITFSDTSILSNVDKVKYYYMNPKSYTIDTDEYPIYEDPYDETSELVSESTVEAYESEEIPQETVTESKVSESYEDFKTITVTPTVSGSTLKVPLQTVNSDGETVGITGAGALIGRRFKIYINYLYNKPQIDVANGIANTYEEILLDNVYELTRLIKFSPTNGTKIVYRLDSNYTYTLTSTITIWDGMDVEIRGGTNSNAVIDCTKSGRAFIVQDQAKLTLSHITIQNANVTTSNGSNLVSYYKEYGGAILVMYEAAPSNDYFGILTMDNCTIKNCKASYGGAIYAFHAGLNLTNCEFTENTSLKRGGAVYYSAELVNMTMNNVTGYAGEEVTMICYVTDTDSEPVTSGTVKFYNEETYLSTFDLSDTTDGSAVLTYTIPSDATSKIPITAYYYGGMNYDTQGVRSYILINVPVKLTGSIDDVYNVFPGDIITLTATAITGDNKVYTASTGYFTVNGTKITATVVDGVYTASYTVPTSVKSDLSISFSIPAANLTCSSATIHIIYGITGYFINTGNIKDGKPDFTIDDSTVDNWVSHGVTDLYVRAVNGLSDIKSTRLYEVIEKTKDTDIRVHAVMNVFYDINKVKGTRWDTSMDDRISIVKTGIKQIVNGVGNDLTGFCFDYIRYQGTTRVTDSSKQDVITAYVQSLTDYIASFDERYTTSVTLMPETSDAKYTYGQAPRDMLQYATYGLPMVYAGNYNQDTSWITSTMKWYNDIYQYRFIGILQAYTDDSNVYATKLSGTTLNNHISALMKGGGNGYALFREGAILSYPSSWKKLNGDE